MAEVKLNVPDISCGHCERAISTALNGVAGVQSVRVDIPGKQVSVAYDDRVVDLNRLKDVLQAEDYPVESVA